MLITCTPKEENIVGDRTKVVAMMQVLGPWILSFFLRRRQWTSFSFWATKEGLGLESRTATTKHRPARQPIDGGKIETRWRRGGIRLIIGFLAHYIS